jgi:ketosteroid isomerase-like protein
MAIALRCLAEDSPMKEATMSDAASNKKLIEQIFAAAGNPDPAVRDRALFAASLADDAIWTVTGKQSIMNDLHGHVRTRLAERTRTIAHRFIADVEHVAVEAKGNNVTQGGVRYDNDYCLVFRLEGGKIKEIREYCDSVLTEKALGEFPVSKIPAAI